jgi:hypothetical protein
MKKRIFIGMAALFFAAITFYNVQVNQNDGDISLENVALMAQASGEIPTITCGQYSGACWTVSAHSNCSCNWVGSMGTYCVPC